MHHHLQRLFEVNIFYGNSFSYNRLIKHVIGILCNWLFFKSIGEGIDKPVFGLSNKLQKYFLQMNTAPVLFHEKLFHKKMQALLWQISIKLRKNSEIWAANLFSAFLKRDCECLP